MNSYNSLLNPIVIAGKKYRNRIGASPMGRMEFDLDGNPSAAGIAQCAQKAANGCGVVIVGETFVDAEFSYRGKVKPPVFDVSDKELLKKVAKYPASIHKYGAVALVELQHCGQSKVGKSCDNKIALGPMDSLQTDGIRNVAMDREMMEHVADNYARTAYFMKEAGFDGAVIMSGHGWLIHQFLSPRTNHRVDEFGGSMENRARFPRMIFRRIREVCRYNFLLEPRISASYAYFGSEMSFSIYSGRSAGKEAAGYVGS